MIFYIALLICATIAGGKAIIYHTHTHGDSGLRMHLLWEGISCCVWSMSAAIMGLTSELEVARTCWVLLVSGMTVFFMSEICWFIYKSAASASAQFAICCVLGILSVADIVLYGAMNKVSFRRIGQYNAVSCELGITLYYHLVYLAIVFGVIVVLFAKWKKGMQFERDRGFQRTIRLAEIFSALALVLDVLVSLHRIPMIMFAPYGGVMVYLIMVYIANVFSYYEVSENTLSRYVYSSEDVGFFALNLEGRLVLINPGAKALLGIEKVYRQRLSELFALGDTYDRDMVKSILTNMGGNWKFHAKKTDVSCSLNFSVAVDKDGEPYCLICSLYDLTKEEELMADIKAASAAKGNFLASMSHEIRTPINAVLGMNEMIMREATREDTLQYAHDIEHSGKALLGVVNDILDYSKIESGRMDIIPVEYQLTNVLHEVFSVVRDGADKKGLQFDYEVDASIPNVLYGDEIRVKQVLSNIASNAVKYTEHGSITILVNYLKKDEDDIVLTVQVKDTGKGIHQKALKELFSPFERADRNENRNIEGTGLGLAIVGSLVQMMDGEIFVESEYEKGSVFTVSLVQHVVDFVPVGDFKDSFEHYAVEQEEFEHQGFEAPAAKVLVVDDNQTNLEVVQFLLKNTKVKVDVASDGMSALSMIEKNTYQVIFLDHMMPGMDGVETIRRIREGHMADHVPIIALTANDVAGAKSMYQDYGFADYLPKPIVGKALEKKLLFFLPEEYIHYDQDTSASQEMERRNAFRIQYGRYEESMDKESDTELIYANKQSYHKEEILHIFIINPAAGNGRNLDELRCRIEGYQDIRGFVFTTSGQEDETVLIRKIQKYFAKDRLRVYCCGGSGTVRNVLNGIEDFERVEVAFCPHGLTNDFLQCFGEDQAKFADLDNLVYGDIVDIDYIKTNHGVALNTFSVGFDSNVVKMLNRFRTLQIIGEKFPYMLALFYSLFLTAPDEYEIEVDGKIYEGSMYQVIFGNGKILGGSFHFASDVSICDGKASLMIALNLTSIKPLAVVTHMLFDKQEKLRAITECRECSKISIRKKDGEEIAMNFDGEMVYGVERWEAEMVHKGLHFVVPKGVKVRE